MRNELVRVGEEALEKARAGVVEGEATYVPAELRWVLRAWRTMAGPLRDVDRVRVLRKLRELARALKDRAWTVHEALVEVGYSVETLVGTPESPVDMSGRRVRLLERRVWRAMDAFEADLSEEVDRVVGIVRRKVEEAFGGDRSAVVAGRPSTAMLLDDARGLVETGAEILWTGEGHIKVRWPVTEIVLEDTDGTDVQVCDLVVTIQLGTDRRVEVTAVRMEDGEGERSSGGYLHPHVDRGGRVCMGGGKAGVEGMMVMGLFGAAMGVVEAVLRTYNVDSPYEPLARWHVETIDCPVCGGTISEEEGYCCEACERTVCDDCVTSCECGRVVLCRGCAEQAEYQCHECGRLLCGGCNTVCQECGDCFCEYCRDQKMTEVRGEWVCNECVEVCPVCGGPMRAGDTVKCSECGKEVCPDCVEDGVCGDCRGEERPAPRACSQCGAPGVIACGDCGRLVCGTHRWTSGGVPRCERCHWAWLQAGYPARGPLWREGMEVGVVPVVERLACYLCGATENTAGVHRCNECGAAACGDHAYDMPERARAAGVVTPAGDPVWMCERCFRAWTNGERTAPVAGGVPTPVVVQEVGVGTAADDWAAGTRDEVLDRVFEDDFTAWCVRQGGPAPRGLRSEYEGSCTCRRCTMWKEMARGVDEVLALRAAGTVGVRVDGAVTR